MMPFRVPGNSMVIIIITVALVMIISIFLDTVLLNIIVTVVNKLQIMVAIVSSVRCMQICHKRSFIRFGRTDVS